MQDETDKKILEEFKVFIEKYGVTPILDRVYDPTWEATMGFITQALTKARAQERKLILEKVEGMIDDEESLDLECPYLEPVTEDAWKIGCDRALRKVKHFLKDKIDE